MLTKPDTFKGIKELVNKLYLIDWSTKPVLTPEEFYRPEV
jgi:hypothetical protein